MKKYKKKNINQLYLDFFFSKRNNKLSQDKLIDKANLSLRKAFSDIESLLAKTYFLTKENNVSRAELRNIYNLRNKLATILDNFKYKIMR